MVFCMVKTCKERTGRMRVPSNIRVTFHIFPADVKRKEQWAKAIGVKIEKVNKHSRICSKHFDEEMFDRTSLSCVRLRKHAVPHLQENNIARIQIKEYFSINNDSFIDSHDWENNQKNKFDDNEIEINYNPHEWIEETFSPIENKETREFEILEYELMTKEEDCSIVKNANKVEEALEAMDFECFSDEDNYSYDVKKVKNEEVEIENHESLLKDVKDGSNETFNEDCFIPKEIESIFNCDKETYISPKNNDSPFTKLLVDQLKRQQQRHDQEVKMLMQTHRQLKKRITTLISIIQKLKSKKKKMITPAWK